MVESHKILRSNGRSAASRSMSLRSHEAPHEADTHDLRLPRTRCPRSLKISVEVVDLRTAQMCEMLGMGDISRKVTVGSVLNWTGNKIKLRSGLAAPNLLEPFLSFPAG